MTILRTAVRIIEAMTDGRLLVLADDEQQAESRLVAKRPGDRSNGRRAALRRNAQPLDSLARVSRPHLDYGKRLVLVGSDRDLRFLRPRVARRLGVSFGSPDNWDGLGPLPPEQAGAINAPADRGFIDENRVKPYPSPDE